MKNLLKCPVFYQLATLFVILFLTNAADAQTTYYSRATGAWNNNTTWSLTSGGSSVGAGIFPVAGDIVNIERGFTVNLPASMSAACATLNLTTTNPGNATLVFNNNSSLTVSGNIKAGTIGTTKVAVITMTAGGTITCNGNLTLGSDAACNITQGALSTVKVNGTATVLQPGAAAVNAWNVNSGTATVTGLFTLDGTNTTANRKSNLVITTGTFNANGGIQVNGTTAATKSINMTGASSVLNVGGAGISGAAGATFTRGSGTSVVNYNAAGNQPNIGNYNYFNLKITGSGIKTLQGTTIVNGTLTVSAGTVLALSTFNITAAVTALECGAAAGSAVTGTGNFQLAGNLNVTDAAGAGTSAASISAPVVLGGNRTFTVADDGSAATDLTISAVISGANSLTKAGAGTLQLLASNTYTSTTTITAGTLLYGINDALASGAVTVNGGKLDIQGFNDAVGVVTLTNGTITGTSGVLAGLSYTVSNGTISAILGGTGNLTKTTAGTVTLSANNTYTGATTISAGTLSINSVANFGTASSLGTGSTTPTISMAANTILLYTGTGHASNRAVNLTGNAVNINASGTGTLSFSGGISGTNRSLVLTGTGNAEQNGAITTGTGAVTKSGTGTWKLGTANTFTGLTTISAGTLQYAANNALASGGITVNGGILDIATFTDAVGAVTLINGSINGTTGTLSGTSYSMQNGNVSAILAGTGALTKTTAGVVTLSGVNTYTGRTTINAGILSVASIGDGSVAGNMGAASNVATNLVLGGGTLQYTGASATTNRNYVLTAGTTSVIELTTSNLTISGASTNTTGGITKKGSGTLTLSGNNLHTGATTIAEGTLKIGASERISNASALVVNGTFDLNGFNETAGALSGAGTVTSSSAGSIIFTVGNTTSTVFSGIILNGSATSLAFTKTGTGSLSLSGNNTYTGKTTISAGSLILAASNVLPDNQVVLSGGTLSTGSGTGFNETIGDLVVSANASINLGSGVHTLTIANSSANTWSATTLTINGWVGSGGILGGGSAGRIIVGVGGLTAAQLAKIAFTGFNPGASITASGELVPVVTIYYSTGSVAPNVLTNWKTARNGTGSSPANFTSGNMFIIQATHNMATTATWSVSGLGSKVWIENGGTLTANNAITLAAASSFQIDNGGTYIHNNNATPATTIFAGTEVFNANSNVVITNWVNTTTAITAGVTLPYGNIDINWNAGGSWSQSLTGSVNLTAGDFIITSLGGTANEFVLTPANSGSALVLTVGGNLTVGAGTLSFVGGGASQNKSCTVNVAGDISITGTINLNSTVATSGTVILNAGGNFTVTGTGALKNSLGNAGNAVNFNKTDGNQSFSSAATGINSNNITFNVGTASSTNTLELLSNFIMANGASLNVLDNATINCGTNIVQATVANTQGNFTLNNGATILVGSTAGISASGATGNIQTAATRFFGPAANYVYNGLAAQSAGTGLTAAHNLEINNPAGVSLNVSAIVSSTLTLTDGNINCGTNTLSVSNNAVDAIIRTNGYIIGFLERAITTGANVYDYPVGTVTGYTPASLDFGAVANGGSITVRSTDGTGGNYPAALSAVKKLNRDWAISNNGVTGFTVNAAFSFLPGDLMGAVTTGELRAYRAEPGPAITYTAADDYDISGTTFNYFNLTSFSSTAGFTEFGAGSCNAGFTAGFSKTMASACGGGADGTITVTATGGTGPYIYSWTGPGSYSAATAAITGLAPGDYTVEVSEVSGCSVTIPDITIWQALPPLVTSTGANPGSCGPTGYITLYGSYGIAPFRYSIDGVNYFASNTFTNLASGTYTGYVKDSAGCVGTKTGIILTAASPVSIAYNARPASSCANNGSIELYLTGGVAPYTYSINDVTYQSGNTFTNLAGGTYTGWVKDANGCKSSFPGIVVSKASPVTVTASKLNSSACSNTGFIELHAGGGVPGYTYSLNNITYQSGNSFTGLAAGTYNGWVMDSKGCKNVVFGITIATDPASVITVSSIVSGSGGCSNSGTIQLFRTGGVGPFTYSLDNITYQSSNTFTGLAGGTYTGWVKDSRGCRGSRTGINLTQASAVSLTETHTNTSICITDGTIQLNPAGGVAPYTFSLDDISYQADNHFSGLAANTYTGWVKDAKGCKASVSITISTNAMVVTSYVTDASNCTSATGSIQLFRTGGVNPYTYSLDGINYQSSNVFTGLTAGDYDGYVKDARGCFAVQLNISVGPSCARQAARSTDKPVMKSQDTKMSEKQPVLALRIQAYPNPSNAAFTLALETVNNENVDIRVTDIMGRVVYYTAGTGKNVYRFGDQFKAGIYLVQVQQGKEKQTIKLIKE